MSYLNSQLKYFPPKFTSSLIGVALHSWRLTFLAIYPLLIVRTSIYWYSDFLQLSSSHYWNSQGDLSAFFSYPFETSKRVFHSSLNNTSFLTFPRISRISFFKGCSGASFLTVARASRGSIFQGWSGASFFTIPRTSRSFFLSSLFRRFFPDYPKDLNKSPL